MSARCHPMAAQEAGLIRTRGGGKRTENTEVLKDLNAREGCSAASEQREAFYQ